MSKATTELKIEVLGGRICMPNAIPDGKYRLVLEEEESRQNTKTANIGSTAKVATNLDDVLILIEASKLSLEDDFMKYQPGKDENGVKYFKAELTEVIKNGVADFYRPKFDPSFLNEEHTEICYIAGKKPAVGKSYNVWVEMAKKFCPERDSRLGKKSQYIAFCGWLIKKLVESGWSREKAWNAVCTDSKELGHYWNSENAKQSFETTKSREILGLLYDLANTYKLLADDDEGANKFWVAGGNFSNSNNNPLADLICNNFIDYFNNGSSVGWLVLSK